MKHLILILLLASCSDCSKEFNSIPDKKCETIKFLKINNDTVAYVKSSKSADFYFTHDFFIDEGDYSDCVIEKNKKICNLSPRYYQYAFRLNSIGGFTENFKTMEHYPISETSGYLVLKRKIYRDNQLAKYDNDFGLTIRHNYEEFDFIEHLSHEERRSCN